MFKKLLYLMSFVLVLAVTGTASADQQTITIDNPGFEDPVLGEDDWTWLDVPGWTWVGGEGPGIWHVTSADFDPVVAPEGQNVLYTENAVGDAGGVAQVLTETFAANMDYTLTVEVGNSYYYYNAGYSVQLLAGGIVIAEDNDTLWPEYYKWATSTVAYTYDPADSVLVGQPLEIRLLNLGLDKDNPPAGDSVGVEFDNVTLSYVAGAEPGITIPVDPDSDLAAANALAIPGDTIEFAEGTYILTSQIEIKDGVTYKGAGPGLTIIDGNDITRAFVAWGDRGATNGQVDVNGVSVPNLTGPTGWVLDGLTIQNCVSDTDNRQDILSAARDLLNNYTGTPYTLVTAQDENGGVTDNPGWFDILSGSADDDLTDVELQAYLDGNPVGSAGHLVVNDDKSGDGGAIFIDNAAVGTIANCDLLNNHTPAEGNGDDGGAINITGRSTITINDCLFNGNYAVSPDSVAVDGFSGHGGHIVLQGGSVSAITPGTTLIANRCVFLNGNAEDDGGAIRTGAVGSIVRLDACWFEGNTSWDNGNVLMIGNESSHELTVTNCIFVNNITKADNSPDRMCEVRRNSKFINCTFVGNNQEDQDMIYNNANTADTDADGTDDEMADATQVINCIFANNVVGNGDDVLGSRNNDFTIAATNCIFFGNTLQNGNAADNTQRPDVETGSILTDPLLDANYVPGEGSDAIDGGVDPATVGVTLTTDYNGDERPQGAAYDIGAYEIAAAPTNLIQNGGFDDASAWVILEHTVPAVTTIDPAFMDDAPSQGVAPCLRIASADNSESRPIVYQKLALVAGQEYMVSSAIKILDATPASPSGTWFQIYMSPEEPDPVPEQTIDWNPPYKIFNIDAWGINIADFIGFDGLFADGSQSFQVGDGTGLYVPPGDAGTEVDIFLVIKPGQCCRVGSYDILFDNVSVYAK